MIKNPISYLFDLLIALVVVLFLFGAATVVLSSPANATEGGHEAVTFCHKPGEDNQQELTTDDDGFLNGHINHGDILGSCPAIVPTPTPTVTEQPQLCEEIIGRTIEIDHVPYDVIGVNPDTCEPILSIHPVSGEPTPQVCEEVLDQYGRVLIATDCTEFVYNPENPQDGDEEQSPIVPTDTVPPAVEIIDAVETPPASVNAPTGVGTQHLAETGVPVHLLAAGIIGLVVAGWVLLTVARQNRSDQ